MIATPFQFIHNSTFRFIHNSTPPSIKVVSAFSCPRSDHAIFKRTMASRLIEIPERLERFASQRGDLGLKGGVLPTGGAVRRRLEPCERSEKSERHRNYQMLIACAFMVMAFQGALYPPGGVWEDDHANDSRAGTSKLSFTSPAIYIVFASANTLWFLSSTMLLGLLQMGLPMKNKLRASTFIVAVCSAVVVSGSWLVVLAEGGYML
ncbi:hypothetical protein Droror1_Dr00003956 [Drosera rotundifolia]